MRSMPRKKQQKDVYKRQSGTTATTFSPNATVTRAQAVTFLWRAAGSEVIQTAAPFVDVKYGMYYYRISKII